MADPWFGGNIISNNVQGGCSGGIGGGGISVRGASSNTRIIGNVIASNNMPSGGGGISLFAASAPTIKNNIIEGNDGGGQGAALSCSMMRVRRLYKICFFTILPAKEALFIGSFR